MKRLLLYICIATVACARFHQVHSPTALSNALEPSPYDADRLAAVYFYDKVDEKKRDKSAKNHCLRQQLAELREVARSLPIEVVAADISSCRLREQAQGTYDLSRFPTIALFARGKPYESRGRIPVLQSPETQKVCTGCSLFTQPAIERFVKQHLGSEIENKIQAQAAYEQEISKIRASRPIVFPAYGYGWGGWGGPYGWWW